MRRWIIIVCALLAVAACAPVLDRDLMQQGVREFQLSHLLETPEVFKDRLFILGGIIVETKLLADGSQIEGVYIPVDRYGYLDYSSRYEGRFLAVYPRARGLLDPMIFKKGREVTLAGEFTGVRKGKIDEMEYAYPVFEIRQVRLWEEQRDYGPYGYPSYYYSYPGWNPWCYSSWNRPYPCGPYGYPPYW